MERDNRQRREAEKVEAQQRASEAAVALWTEADPASESNPYCRAKDILDPDVKGLRTVPDSVLEAAHGAGIRIAHSGKDAQTMREAEPDAWVFQRGDLLVPLYNEQAEVVGVQAVNPAFKGFMRGGRKAGLYSIAGGTPEDLKTAFDFDPNLPILVCEGYATGDTIAEAVGHPVVVGLDSGNLDAVARQMRETYPERALVIAADNDSKMVNGRPRNVGVEKATAAAKAHGGGVIVPKFGEGAKGTDWNDYASEQGHQEAAKTIREEVERAKIEASITASKMRYYAHERMADAQDNPATAADNQFVADQRSKAAESINEATEQESAVQADAVNAATTPGAAQADMSSIAVRNQTMKDEVKTQRIEVLDGTTNSPQEDPGVQQNLRDEQQQRRAFKRSRGRGR